MVIKSRFIMPSTPAWRPSCSNGWVRNNYFLVVGDIAKQKSSIDEAAPWVEFRLTYNRKLIHAIEINTHTHIKAYMTRICKIMETTRCGTLYGSIYRGYKVEFRSYNTQRAIQGLHVYNRTSIQIQYGIRRVHAEKCAKGDAIQDYLEGNRLCNITTVWRAWTQTRGGMLACIRSVRVMSLRVRIMCSALPLCWEV
jgi:hypothetical protein